MPLSPAPAPAHQHKPGTICFACVHARSERRLSPLPATTKGSEPNVAHRWTMLAHLRNTARQQAK
jgi:hypothetical protein